MSFPLHTEARSDSEPDTGVDQPQFPRWPHSDAQVVDDEQRFFVEWEVPQAS